MTEFAFSIVYWSFGHMWPVRAHFYKFSKLQSHYGTLCGLAGEVIS